MKNLYIVCLIIPYILIPAELPGQDPIKIDSLASTLKYVESDTHQIKILWSLADQYLIADYNKSLQYLGDALDLSKKQKDEILIGTSQMYIGNVYAHSGDYDAGIESTLSAIEIFTVHNRKKELYRCHIIMGIIHDRIYKYDEALEYYFNAVNLANEIKKEGSSSAKELNEHILYNNIGNIYSTKEEDEIAIEYYSKGVELAKTNGDNKNLAVLYNNLGKMHNKSGDLKLALEFLNKALSTREKTKDKAGMAKSYYFLCAHYKEQENYEKALEYAYKSLEMGKEVGSLQTQYTATLFLFEIYYALGDFEEAVDYLWSYKEISDSLYNSKTMNEITRLKMQFDFDTKEAERELQIQHSRFNYLLIISILILGLLILGLFVVLIRFKVKRVKLQKENLEKDIELKNKELATNVIYMVRKNEMINNVAKKLLELKAQAVEQNKKPIQEIVLALQTEADKNVWKEFEIRFQQVHNDFYKHLSEKHPDLSPSESRLVALLRLNMTTKEIAAITHQNFKSIEVARVRLRKKLNLTGTDINLITYLNSL